MVISERAVYATQPVPLRNQIQDLLAGARPHTIEGELLAVIVPDKNLLRGGVVAADVFKSLRGEHYDTIILISPSHTGSFQRISICNLDTYHTPLGELAINDVVRNELCDEDDDIYLDNTGHFHIEGVDVQLPFLQTVLGDFDVVPIIMGEESPDFCRELGHAVGEVMFNRRTLVVASASILQADEAGLERFKEYLTACDVTRLMMLLNSEEVRVEGKGAILVALIAALHRHATGLHILRLEPPHADMPGFLGAVLTR